MNLPVRFVLPLGILLLLPIACYTIYAILHDPDPASFKVPHASSLGPGRKPDPVTTTAANGPSQFRCRFGLAEMCAFVGNHWLPFAAGAFVFFAFLIGVAVAVILLRQPLVDPEVRQDDADEKVVVDSKHSIGSIGAMATGVVGAVIATIGLAVCATKRRNNAQANHRVASDDAGNQQERTTGPEEVNVTNNQQLEDGREKAEASNNTGRRSQDRNEQPEQPHSQAGNMKEAHPPEQQQVQNSENSQSDPTATQRQPAATSRWQIQPCPLPAARFYGPHVAWNSPTSQGEMQEQKKAQQLAQVVAAAIICKATDDYIRKISGKPAAEYFRAAEPTLRDDVD